MKRKRVYGSKYDHMLSDIQANRSTVKPIDEPQYLMSSGLEVVLSKSFSEMYQSLSTWVKYEDPFQTGVPFTPPPCPNVEKVKRLINETEL